MREPPVAETSASAGQLADALEAALQLRGRPAIAGRLLRIGEQFLERHRQPYYADTTDSHARGDLASITNGLGEVTLFRAYSQDGLATSIGRPNGHTVTLEYGPRQRLAASIVQDGSGVSETTRYQYDDAGQLTSVVSPDGTTMGYTYDEAHRMTDLRDSAGNTVHLALDNLGNVRYQEVRDPDGKLVTQSQRTFDALGRLEREQRDAQDPGTRYRYDRGGNLTSVTDPLGRVTTQTMDSFGRVLAQILPAPFPARPRQSSALATRTRISCCPSPIRASWRPAIGIMIRRRGGMCRATRSA